MAHTGGGLSVYIRVPMPYLVADKLQEAPPGQLPEPAPFTTNAFEDAVLVHFVDFDAIADTPKELARLVQEGHRIDVHGQALTPEFRALQVYQAGAEPGFATLDEARASLALERIARPAQPVYVGDAVVDVALFYPVEGAVAAYDFSSSLNPNLPGQEDTANLILDYGPGDP